MKVTGYIVVTVLVVVVFGSMIGLVGFHYPSVIQDEPLRNPQKVLRVEGTNIFMEGGAVIALDQVYASGLCNKLKQSGVQIEVEGARGEPVAIFARQDGWVCGTPWAQPIRIPLIPDRIYKNRRELVAVGVLVGGQPEGAANRSQPVRSGTNRTAVAAGSGRSP